MAGCRARHPAPVSFASISLLLQDTGASGENSGEITLFLLSALVAGLFLAACASSPKPLPRLSENLRSSLGTVGVVTTGPAVTADLDAPVGVVNQAALGAVEGGGVGFASGAGAGALIGLTCGPGAVLCVPIGAVVGGALGLTVGLPVGGLVKGSTAIPDSAATEIRASISRAIGDRDLQDDLRQRVLQNARLSTTGVDLGARPMSSMTSPDNVSLTNAEITTVLEISLINVAFTSSDGGKNPPLALVLTAQARLVGMDGDRVLWNADQVKYASSSAAFSLWAENNSTLLRTEIDNGLDSLAQQISAAIFDRATSASVSVSDPCSLLCQSDNNGFEVPLQLQQDG